MRFFFFFYISVTNLWANHKRRTNCYKRVSFFSVCDIFVQTCDIFVQACDIFVQTCDIFLTCDKKVYRCVTYFDTCVTYLNRCATYLESMSQTCDKNLQTCDIKFTNVLQNSKNMCGSCIVNLNQRAVSRSIICGGYCTRTSVTHLHLHLYQLNSPRRCI